MATFGFETETWTLGGNAGFAVVQGAEKYAGDRALRLRLEGGTPPDEGTAKSPTINIIDPGVPRVLTLWVKLGSGQTSIKSRIQIGHFADGVGGSPTILQTVPSIFVSTSWTQYTYNATPLASTDAVWIATDYDDQGAPHPIGDLSFYFDQIAYGDDVITATIKQAIVDDLTDVDGTGIFSTTIAEVGTTPKRIDDAKFPGAYVFSGEGSASLSSLTDKLRSGTQRYIVQLAVHSSTPNADMDTFMDDVRNAFERETSNLNTINVSNIRNFQTDVGSWDWFPTDQTIDEGKLLAEVEVIVRYDYNAGTL